MAGVVVEATEERRRKVREPVGEPVLLTVKNAAARLKLSVPTIYRLVAAGLLQAVRVGKRGVHFTQEALAAYAAEQTQQQQAQQQDRCGKTTDAQRQAQWERSALAALDSGQPIPPEL